MERRTTAALLAVALAFAAPACADDTGDAATPEGVTTTIATTTTGGDRFCEAFSHLIVLLAPSADPVSPADTEAGFAEAATWFEQARTSAPAAIGADVAAYASAWDAYVHYLSGVGFDLDQVFSTAEGRDLAIDTSHTLTPAIVDHVATTCGLSFGEEQPPPEESDG